MDTYRTLLIGMMLAVLACLGHAQSFRFVDKGEGELALYEGDRPVLVYVYGMTSHPQAPNKTRASYIHPLYGLDGEEITDDFPKDHYHHRGVFWTWIDAEWQGRHYDFWTLNQDHVRQKFENWRNIKAQDNTAHVGVDNGWYVGDTAIVDEKLDFIVHPAGPVGRAIDVTLTLEAENEPVTISGSPGKGYSGFGVRFNEFEDVKISTTAGLHTQDGMRIRSRWADYSVKLKGRDAYSGVSLFAHPSHPDYPIGWFLRHYGYFGETWPGLKKHTLKKGEPVVLKYRMWVHRGDAEEGQVWKAFRNYQQELNP